MTQQNALVVREPNNQITTNRAQDIDIFRLGKAFAQSGYFQDAKDEAQAVVKIIYGQELGISPAASMSGIHVIQGKPVLSATALAGLIKSRRPLYDYRVIKLDDESCELEFYEHGEKVGRSAFSLAEAKQAELLNGKNVNWKKYPKNMLFARAISNGARLYCPDIFTGSPVYTPDELGENVNEAGEILLNPTEDFAPNKPVASEPRVNKNLGNFNPKPVVETTATEPGALKNRAIIKDLLDSAGINPTTFLKKYDTLKTQAQRDEALEKTRWFVEEKKAVENAPVAQTATLATSTERDEKLAIVKEGLSGQNWDFDETATYLGQWNVEAIDAASDEILDSIIADMRDGKMIL